MMKPAVAEIFETMAARARPEALQGVQASLGYRITGEGGGEWTVTVASGAVKVRGGLQAPAVTTTMAAQDFLDLNLGRLDGMTAFTTGKLKAEGDTSLLLRSARWFRKYSPGQPQAEELLVLKQLISIGQRFTTGPLMGKFLKELRDHRRILGNRCPTCRRVQTPPREVCAVCRVAVEELVEVGPEGEVVSYDITYYASPDPLTGETRETPYGTIHVLLDGCKGTETFWHFLKKEDLLEVERGTRVRPVWSDKRVGTVHDILYFEKVR
jgi:uncharacterized OB-fold protein/putative sterol carrier protein